MKALLFARIPSVCICFTGITLASTLTNFLSGEHVSPFFLQLFGWIVVCQIIDWLLTFANFKTWRQYAIIGSLVLYGASLGVALGFHWITCNIQSLIAFTLIFLAVDIFVFWYFYRRQQLLAQELNQLLQDK